MNKLIIILLLIAYPTILGSQEQKMFVISDIKTYSASGRNYQHSYTYDTNGNQTYHLIKLLSDSGAKNFSYSEKRYDENQDVLEEVVFLWRNEDWQNFIKNIYTYADSGKYESKTYYKGEGKEWEMHEKYIYKYNENLKYDTTYYFIPKDGNWVEDIITLHTYNDNNKLIIKEDKQNINNNWLGNRLYNWQYDQMNRLTGETISYYNYYKMKYEFNSGKEFKYNDSNRIIEILYLKPSEDDSTIVESAKNEYNYNNNNKMVERKYSRIYDSVWRILNYDSLYYDEESRLVAKLRASVNNYDEYILINDALDSTYYDNNGETAEEKTYVWNDNQWEAESWKQYHYHNNGLTTWESKIFSNNEWIDYRKYELTFDEDDNIKTARYSQYDSIEWVPYTHTIEIIDSYEREYNFLWSYFAELDWTYVLGPISVEESLKNSFKVYPNPTSQYLTVDFIIPENSEITITLYNILGQKLDVLFSGSYSPGNFIRVFNLMKYPQGTYYIETVVNDRCATEMIVIQK